jgi:hypothetical protein
MKKLENCKRRRVIETEVRFDFSIPNDVAPDKTDLYIWGKLNRLCRGLSKNGLKVTPIVPPQFKDL